MKILKLTAIAAVAAVAIAQPAQAKKAPRTYVVNNEAVGVPVFPHDITDRPYVVIGEVKAKVRKATVFSKSSSQKKIYKELWERARKKGADAVINATYGDAHISAMSWGQTNAKGTAIRFTTTAAPTSN
jgi:uncharacterized protein YbjQ (UPF0145 family)